MPTGTPLPGHKTKIVATIAPASSSAEMLAGPSLQHPDDHHRIEFIPQVQC